MRSLYYSSRAITVFNTSLRYHIKCDGTKLLYYTITGQTMQDREFCSSVDTNTCVDILRLDFPGVDDCERCGDINNPLNGERDDSDCPKQSGQGKEMFVEFTVNRETHLRGFEILAHCVEPGFDQNNVPPPYDRKRRQAEECTSPDGIGPRDLPPVPLVSLQT